MLPRFRAIDKRRRPINPFVPLMNDSMFVKIRQLDTLSRHTFRCIVASNPHNDLQRPSRGGRSHFLPTEYLSRLECPAQSQFQAVKWSSGQVVKWSIVPDCPIKL